MKIVEFKQKERRYLAIPVLKNTYIAFIQDRKLIVRMGYEFHQEQDEFKLPDGNLEFRFITDKANMSKSFFDAFGGFKEQNYVIIEMIGGVVNG